MNKKVVKKIIIKDNRGGKYEEYYNKEGLITKRTYIKLDIVESYGYDKNNNLIYYRNSSNKCGNFDKYYKYNDEGLIIESITDNIKTYKTYNDVGLLIHSKNNMGYEIWCEYDENNNLIKMSDSRGFYECYEYNDKGLRVRTVNSRGHELKEEYNDKGLLIYSKTSYKNTEVFYNYNSAGNIVSSIVVINDDKVTSGYINTYNRYGYIKTQCETDGKETIYSYEYY